MSHLDERYARQRLDQVPRLFLDALRMSEVAGVLVGDPHLDLAPRRGQSDLGQPLGQVLDATLELWIEVLQVGAAAGRVDDERVELLAPVCPRVRVAKALGTLEVSVVR